jgi:hypothetical protein
MTNEHFDAVMGSIFIEIPIMLSSESGEDKHIDLNNQGLFLAYEIGRHLKSTSTQGAALSEMTFWGTTVPGTGEALKIIDFSKDL